MDIYSSWAGEILLVIDPLTRIDDPARCNSLAPFALHSACDAFQIPSVAGQFALLFFEDFQAPWGDLLRVGVVGSGELPEAEGKGARRKPRGKQR